MALADRVTVTTTATLLARNEISLQQSVLLKNKTATESIFLGGPDVTTSTGFEWASGDGPLAYDLASREALWGVVASSSQTVHALRSDR